MGTEKAGCMENLLKSSGAKKVLSAAVLSFFLSGQSAIAETSHDGSFQIAQNINGQQQQGQGFSQQQQFLLSVENRSGVDLDVLRVVNGQYARIGTAQNGFGSQFQTFTNDQLFFGYGGQILNSFVVPPNATRPLQIGPDILAAYQNPNQQQQPQNQNQGGQQQQGGLLPPGGQQQTSQPQQQGFLPAPTQSGGQAEIAPPAQKEWPYIDKPWLESPLDAVVLVNPLEASFLKASDAGGLEFVEKDAALSSSVWIVDKEEGSNVGIIRNLQEPGKSLYIDQNALDGSAVSFGSDGPTSPGGKWTIIEYGNYHIIRSVVRPELSLSWETVPTVTSGEGIKGKTAWIMQTIEFWLELQSAFSEGGALARLPETLAKASKKADEEYAEFLAGQERERLAKEAQKAKELEEFNKNFLANQRKTAKVYKRAEQPDALSVQLGVQEPFQLDNGTIQQNFEFATNTTHWLESRILKVSQDAAHEHLVEVKLVPKVTAFVQNGLLYLEVGTDTNSIISVTKNGQIPPTNQPKDTFFIGGVQLAVATTNGAPNNIFPINENSRLDRSRNTDTSEGFDVSADSVGFNKSKSTGSGLGATIQNYKVTGIEARQTDRDRGVTYRWAQYNWTACGLSTQSTNLNDCSYNTPTDLWQEDGAVIYELKDVALSMNMEPTTTVFLMDLTRASFVGATGAVDVQFGIDVEVHAISTRDLKKVPNEDVDAKTAWKAFKGGFKTAARVDKYDFDKNFFEQEEITNELTERIGLVDSVRFDVNLRVDLKDLAQFLN